MVDAQPNIVMLEDSHKHEVAMVGTHLGYFYGAQLSSKYQHFCNASLTSYMIDALLNREIILLWLCNVLWACKMFLKFSLHHSDLWNVKGYSPVY